MKFEKEKERKKERKKTTELNQVVLLWY